MDYNHLNGFDKEKPSTTHNVTFNYEPVGFTCMLCDTVNIAGREPLPSLPICDTCFKRWKEIVAERKKINS